MSSIFADLAYDKMDWLARAVEPFEFKLLKLIDEAGPTIVIDSLGPKAASLFSPEETSVRTHIWMSSDTILEDHPIMLAYPHLNAIDVFMFAEEDISINIENDVPLTSQILIQTPDIAHMQASEIVELAYKAFAGLADVDLDRAAKPQTTRYYELLDLFIDKREKGGYTNFFRLDLIEDLNIKNLDLIGDLYSWIREYVQTGCKSSLHNIAKLKYMSHLGKPIYSIQTI